MDAYVWESIEQVGIKRCDVMSARTVYVVTTKEMLGPQLLDVGVAVLGSRLKAERWINQQIDDLVTEYELDRSSAVTDRFVQIDGWNHTMEYEVAKEEVQ